MEKTQQTFDTSEESPNSPSANTPEADNYTPIPVESFDFPVGAGFVDLSQQYMRLIHWHWHEEVEFILIRNGQARLKLSNESVVLSTGEGAFINQEQLHSVHTCGDEVCTLYSLKFHPAFLFGYGRTTMSAKYLTPVLSSPSLHYMIFRKGDAVTSRILDLIEQSFVCCNEQKFGYELQAKSYLCQLWYLMLPFSTAADAARHAHPQTTLDSARIKQAILFIEKNHAEPLTLEEIADSIHVSKSECCRCFQRSMGLTPFEYLMKFRVFESTRKIMRGDEVAKSISTLAASVGFNSTSYYNKLFRKYLDCTPSEYKKRIGNNVSLT